MSYENVSLWFAYDNNENIVVIDDVLSNDNIKYYCPVCGSEVIPKATNSAIVKSHFAHIDRDKCNQESIVHFWVKNKFLTKGDKFIVKTNEKKEYTCEKVLIEKSYSVDGKTYKPDVTVKTTCGETIYFEIEYSNKKKLEDYHDIWLELNNTVVEIDSKSLINSAMGNFQYNFDALFYKGNCLNVKKKDKYYNLIGKHKEEIIQTSKSKNDSELKKRVKSLDWLWKDILKYKRNEVDIEDLVILIDSIYEDDIYILNNVLEKMNCTNALKEYLKYKQKEIIKTLNDTITKYVDDINVKSFQIEYNKNFYSSFLNSIRIQYNDFDKGDFFYENFTIFQANKEEVRKYIEDKIYDIKHLDFVKNKLSFINDLPKSFDIPMWVKFGKIDDDYICNISTDLFDNNKEIDIYIYYDEIKIYEYKRKTWNAKPKKTMECDVLECSNENIRDFITEYIKLRIAKEKEIVQNGNIENIQDHHKLIESAYYKVIKVPNIDIVKLYKFNNGLYRGIHFTYKNKHYYIHPHFYNRIKGFIIPDNIKTKSNIIRLPLYSSSFYILESYGELYLEEAKDCFYTHKSYFGDKTINLSFKNFNEKYSKLLKYDFVKATKDLTQLHNTIDEIISFYNYNEHGDMIYEEKDLAINIEYINNEIVNILKPLIKIAKTHKKSKEINILLNIKYTKDLDGRYRPWIIKDFIGVLEKFDVYNFNNIIN